MRHNPEIKTSNSLVLRIKTEHWHKVVPFYYKKKTLLNFKPMPKLLKGIRKQEKKHVNTSLHQKFQSRVYLDRPRCGQSFLLPNGFLSFLFYKIKPLLLCFLWSLVCSFILKWPYLDINKFQWCYEIQNIFSLIKSYISQPSPEIL